MKKLLAVVLSAVAVLLNVHVVDQSQKATLRQTSVRLVMDGGMGLFGPQIGFCSGTQIKENIVLTAAHCDMPGASIFANGKKAMVVKKDIDSDLMLLYVERPGSSLAQVADSGVIQGQSVSAVGYPGGVANTITEGKVQGKDLIQMLVKALSGETWPNYTVSTAAVMGGNSGGGLFKRDLLGRYTLVGVVSRGGGSISLSVDLPTIKKFLDK